MDTTTLIWELLQPNNEGGGIRCQQARDALKQGSETGETLGSTILNSQGQKPITGHSTEDFAVKCEQLVYIDQCLDFKNCLLQFEDS